MKSNHSSGPSGKTGELRRTIAGFDHVRICHFCNVLVVLMPDHRVEGQIRILIFHSERIGGKVNDHWFLRQSRFRVKAPAAEPQVS